MRYVRQRDYIKKVGNYKDMGPYYNIELWIMKDQDLLIFQQRGIMLR